MEKGREGGREGGRKEGRKGSRREREGVVHTCIHVHVRGGGNE